MTRALSLLLLHPFRELATLWSRWHEAHAHGARLLALPTPSDDLDADELA